MHKDSTTRRSFIKKVGAGAAGVGFALGAPAEGLARVLERNRADEVVLGVMGTGPRGTTVATYFARLPGVTVRYVCDVDERLVAEARGKVEAAQDAAPEGVVDFRRILDDPDVDALSIHTPDHWHAPAAILALQAGKHVYVEKPCSHNPREGELLIEAARKHDRLVQMGNQRRSIPPVIEAIASVHGGAVGPVHYARSWYASGRGSIGHGQVVEVPSHLDWDLWQGPAPRTVYRDNLHPYKWHWFWRWGTGEAGNNGVHVLDLARWGMDVDYPTLVTSAGGRYFWKDDQETPDTHVVTLNFEGDKSIMWEGLSCSRHAAGDGGVGVSFHGEEGTLVLLDDRYEIYDREDKLLQSVSKEDVQQEVDRAGGGYARDRHHLANFRDAITKGETLNAPIDGGHKSTLLCQLGNIAQRTGRTLTTDPKDGHIVGDAEATKLWGREYAPGWKPEV